MKKSLKRMICFAVASVFFIGVVSQAALATTMGTFTYTYNEWGIPIPSPDAYRVSEFIMGQHLYFRGANIGQWHTPQDLHVWRNRETESYYLYVVDSGNNRIVVLEFYGENYANFHVVDIVTEISYYRNNDTEGRPTGRTTLSNPHGIFVSDWELNRGERWIADTNNQRILHVDENWTVITEILHPGNYIPCPDSLGDIHLFVRGQGRILRDNIKFIYSPGAGDSLIAPDSDFLPTKVVVDFSGRIFAQSRGVNRGLIEFSREGVFAGYMGAPDVEVSIIDQIRRFFQTQEQRERAPLAVPVEFNNVTIDDEGFLFVTTGSPDVDPVARLNAMGDDVLIRNWLVNNSEEVPAGDLWTGTGADISGVSVLVDVAVLPNGVYVVFDRNRGRLFAYDTQGQMLYAWGGPGNRIGFFDAPTALDNMGFTLFALDGGIGANFAAITRFDLTEYGAMINQALDMYNRGMYEESYDYWTEVLRMNGNFGPAYIGLARSLLRQGGEQYDSRLAMEYYSRAMRYFRLQNDRRNYGRAFGFYRRIWVEQYFWIIVVVLGTLFIVPPVVRKIRKVRKEIRES